MPTFDRVSEVYDATRSLRPDVMEAVLDGLEQALGGTNTLLDVGVGTGRFADPLRRLGFEVVGVCLVAVFLAGIYVLRHRKDWFSRDPHVTADTWASRNLRLWQVLLVWVLAMELLIGMLLRV